mgnify:CR=1 FL=1
MERENLLKKGSVINHLWLKKKKDNVKTLLSNITVSSLENLNSLDKILDIVLKIEKERNELMYGSPAKEEKLKEQINLFFELKREVENA